LTQRIDVSLFLLMIRDNLTHRQYVCIMGRDSRKSRQKMVKKNMARFCENRRNHGKITAVYIAANSLKFMVSNSRKKYTF